MTTLDLSTAFDTTVFVDPAQIYRAMYAATIDGVLIVEGIPYMEELGSYRCVMSALWGKEDDAVAVYKATEGKITENAPFDEECKWRQARLARLGEIHTPPIVVENERFFLTVARFLNAYADEVEPLDMQSDSETAMC